MDAPMQRYRAGPLTNGRPTIPSQAGEWVRFTDAQAALDAERAARVAAEAEVARLTEVLWPFADAADEGDRYEEPDEKRAPVTYADCRKARAALEANLTDQEVRKRGLG